MAIRPERRAVFITGTSTGIGRAAALRLDGLGFQVFASVRNERDGRELRSQASPGLVPVLMDVTDPAAVARARDAVRQAVGEAGLWGLVNNAGISFRAPLEYVPLPDLRKLFEVNVFGTLAVTQALLPMLRRARGRIVNVGSVTSLIVTPFHGPYSASKQCLSALSDALRLELGPFGVQVSLLLYGGVRTALWDKVVRSTDAVTQQFPADVPETYLENQARALRFFLARGEHGLQPEEACRPIVHALTARRPRRTYLVGADARFYGLLGKVLPGRLRDRVVLRTIGMRG